jgi:putative transposase
VEAFSWETAPKYLMRYRDSIYDIFFRNRVKHMGIKEVISAPRSPWQNLFVEREIGSISELLGIVAYCSQHALH